MVIAHAATGFRSHFHPGIIKHMDLGNVYHFGTSNDIKIKKCLYNESQEAPKVYRKNR